MEVFVTMHPSGGPCSSAVKSRRLLSRNGRLVLLLAVLLGISLPAFSANVQVGNCLNLASYPTISQAVSSVPAGSTIRICPNTYAEQVVIKKSLTLIGVSATGASGATASGANNPTIVSPVNGVQVNAADLSQGNQPTAAQIAVLGPPIATAPITVNISNLIVDGSNNQLSGCGTDLVGIYYQNASGTINHVVTRFQELDQSDFGCQDGLAIYAQAGYSDSVASTVTIENNSVHDYDKNGITVDGDQLTATVEANYVVGIGATPLIAQNGIQISDGAVGKVSTNTVTDDVYVNPSDCASNNSCYSASGILNYDSSGTSSVQITISGNTVSNTQGGIVTYGDTNGTADYNTVTNNKITTSPAAGPYLIDGIDLCSNYNMASSNTVFNSSGSGVHIDSSCTESTGQSGNGTSAVTNTINEACAGVLEGNGSGNAESGNITYNVLQTTFPGDSCPVSNQSSARKPTVRLKPSPKRH
jgi:parallel beta-helix repeat protein